MGSSCRKLTTIHSFGFFFRLPFVRNEATCKKVKRKPRERDSHKKAIHEKAAASGEEEKKIYNIEIHVQTQIYNSIPTYIHTHTIRTPIPSQRTARSASEKRAGKKFLRW